MTFKPIRHYYTNWEKFLHFWASDMNEAWQADIIISANVMLAAYVVIKNKYLSLTVDNVGHSTGLLNQTWPLTFRRMTTYSSQKIDATMQEHSIAMANPHSCQIYTNKGTF